MLLLLILAAPPPPSSAYVQIKNQGVSKGYARTINCSGSGVTCAVNTTTAEATLTVTATASDAGSSGGNWDGGPAIPACAAGYVLDADGGVLYCVNTIANATLAATATALASNPTDCSTDQYATAIAVNGNLTCAQVATSQLSGTITNAQLASSYSGVGSCGSNTWASTLNANGSPTCTQADFNNIHGQVTDAQLDGGYSGVGACGSHLWASTLSRNASPTCTQINYTDLAGCDPGQGVAGAVQYNAAGCEGGITNLTSDGTNPIVTGVTSHPASPTANIVHYDLQPLPSFPGFPHVRDNFMGTPIPLGVLDSFSGGLGFISWDWQCTRKPSAGALVTVYGNAPTASNWATSPGQVLANTTLVSRIPWMTGTTASGFQAAALIQDQQTTLAGNAFIWYARVNMSVTATRAAWFFGLSSQFTTFTTAPPSTLLGTIYFGCDGNGSGTQANLHVCSNDDTGSATCTDLGSSFPCRTNDTIYDLWLASAPRFALLDGGLGASYYVVNLDAGVSAAGTTSNDLPDSGQGMRWYLEGNQGDAGSPAVITAGFHSTCIANNL